MTRRIERVNNLFRQEISELLQREIKDPRLGDFVAVTGVVTSADLKYARVFVSRICEEKERQETLVALAAASGFLRNGLKRRLRLRRIPELCFEWDDSIERGAQMLELIDRVVAGEDS